MDRVSSSLRYQNITCADFLSLNFILHCTTSLGSDVISIRYFLNFYHSGKLFGLNGFTIPFSNEPHKKSAPIIVNDTTIDARVTSLLHSYIKIVVLTLLVQYVVRYQAQVVRALVLKSHLNACSGCF